MVRPACLLRLVVSGVDEAGTILPSLLKMLFGDLFWLPFSMTPGRPRGTEKVASLRSRLAQTSQTF